MKEFIDIMIEKAMENPKTVAFPESSNVDILKTAQEVVEKKIGYPVMLGNEDEIKELASKNQVSTTGFKYFDYTNEENRIKLAEEYTSKYDEFSQKAVIRKSKDPVRCAMFLLKLDKVDCVAAGKEYSTGDVVLEAMTIVGLAEGIESPSSIGIADIPGFTGSQGSMLGLADCAITAMPDEKTLAGIAISSADTVSTLLDWEPRVAMLSFSTCGSSEHESIDVIRKAVEIVHEKRPDIKIDGEFQLDSAIIPEVAKKKVNRESDVAGRANVVIFPNLHAGNIGVKMVQIFGHANAYGPVLQGFLKPVCDFSRSAPVSEMLGNVAMLIIRANEKR
ncbi:MAG: phosphate acetyltransferase [Lachnospiraceae bacterium]|jgi:phosphate acetyltransferase|nr:phosphate acetyltransferase [Lachnospiraceae bacterium]